MSEFVSTVTATQQLYMSDVPSDQSLPKHYIWQSPLLLPQDLSDFDELNRRIRKAGNLWLKNNDLRCFNQLIITHKPAWISYVFQRSQLPNQYPLTAGPIPRRLIREGTPLPPYPLIFQEVFEI